MDVSLQTTQDRQRAKAVKVHLKKNKKKKKKRARSDSESEDLDAKEERKKKKKRICSDSESDSDLDAKIHSKKKKKRKLACLDSKSDSESDLESNLDLDAKVHSKKKTKSKQARSDLESDSESDSNLDAKVHSKKKKRKLVHSDSESKDLDVKVHSKKTKKKSKQARSDSESDPENEDLESSDDSDGGSELKSDLKLKHRIIVSESEDNKSDNDNKMADPSSSDEESTNAARTEKQARKGQDTTAGPRKAGPESSKNVQSNHALQLIDAARTAKQARKDQDVTGVDQASAGNQSTDAARTKKQAREKQDTTVAPEKAGPKSSKKARKDHDTTAAPEKAGPKPSQKHHRDSAKCPEADSDTDTADEIRNIDFHSDISDSEVMNANGDQLRRCLECKEELPSLISPQLATHFKDYCKIRRKEGRWSNSVFRMSLEICNLLRKAKAKDKTHLEDDRRAQSARIRQKDDQLSIKQFSTLKPVSPLLQTILRSKPGYYGMKGNTIITNMLLGLFPQQTTPIDCLLPPLPYTILHSCRTGKILYPECDDDDEVDALCQKNITTFKLSRSKAKGKQRETKTEVDESMKAAAAALLELNMAPHFRPKSATTAQVVANDLFPEVRASTSHSIPMTSQNRPEGNQVNATSMEMTTGNEGVPANGNHKDKKTKRTCKSKRSRNQRTSALGPAQKLNLANDSNTLHMDNVLVLFTRHYCNSVILSLQSSFEFYLCATLTVLYSQPVVSIMLSLC
ncbi:hypothetical protein HD554DRAFT_2299672 [Boletus coccyginus]|nr:hypothetical protein HD554DRAFT_2299672 [Boletus coccyginus]